MVSLLLGPIINYNTEYSGIKEADLVDVKVNLDDVHKVLRKLINKDTIIVGHSLDSDFKTLKIIHKR
jgi:RNA exonuclease 1